MNVETKHFTTPSSSSGNVPVHPPHLRSDFCFARTFLLLACHPSRRRTSCTCWLVPWGSCTSCSSSSGGTCHYGAPTALPLWCFGGTYRRFRAHRHVQAVLYGSCVSPCGALISPPSPQKVYGQYCTRWYAALGDASRVPLPPWSH